MCDVICDVITLPVVSLRMTSWCYDVTYDVVCHLQVVTYDVTYIMWHHILMLWCQIWRCMSFASRYIWRHIRCLQHHKWRHMHLFSFLFAYSGFISMNLNFLLELLNGTFARTHNAYISSTHDSVYFRNKGNPFSKLHPSGPITQMTCPGPRLLILLHLNRRVEHHCVCHYRISFQSFRRLNIYQERLVAT